MAMTFSPWFKRTVTSLLLGGYAVATALDELYGLGYLNCDQEDALYEAVTLEEVQQVIRTYLDPARCVISIVAPGSEPAKPA